MTCQEMRDHCGKFFDTTTALRAVMLKHLLDCKECNDWLHSGGKPDFASRTIGHAIADSDWADPEFRETAIPDIFGDGGIK